MNAETRTEKLSVVDDELVSLYCETTRQPEWIVRAFLLADQEPPTRDQWLQRGVLASENKLLSSWLTNPDSYAGDFSGSKIGETE